MLFSTLFLAGRVQGGTNNAGWSKESINEIRDKRRIQKEFMAAMHANDPKVGKGRRKGRDKKRKLYESLLSHARKLEQNNNGQQQDNEGEYGTWSWVLNGNGEYQDLYEGQYQGEWCETYQEEWAALGQGEWTSNGRRRADDANAQNGNNNNNNEQNMYGENNDIPFDMAAKAFKYSGCAAIKEFDNENGNPLVMNTYAVFRLCPAESCNKYSMKGCGKNYGEYVVEMKTYLSSILDYYEYRYEDYCCYCEPCDWEYQKEAKNALQECYDLRNDQEWQQNKQQQQTNWEEYYDANNGDMSGWNNGYGGSTTSAQSQQQYTSGNEQGQYRNANYYNNADNQEEATEDNNGNSNNKNSNNSQQNYKNGASYNGNQYYGSYYSANQNYNVKYQANDDEDDDQAMQNGKGYWGNDGIWYENNNMDMYQCIDGSMCDQCQYQNEQLYMPCDSYVCGDYYKYCSEWYGDQDEVNVSDFLECVQFDSEDGQEYYIGPHCGSDHYTISLGVFSDENCLNYAGETMSLASLLGYQYTDEDLFKIPKECVSCDGTVSKSMIRSPKFTMLVEDSSHQYFFYLGGLRRTTTKPGRRSVRRLRGFSCDRLRGCCCHVLCPLRGICSVQQALQQLRANVRVHDSERTRPRD
jgi:hypothetical protein